MDDERNQMMQAVRAGRRARNAALTDYEKELDVKFASMFATVLKHCASQHLDRRIKVPVGPDHASWGRHASDYLKARFEDAGCSVLPVTSARVNTKGRRLVIWCPSVGK